MDAERERALAFLVGEPEVSVQMTPLQETHDGQEYRSWVVMADGDERVEFEAGVTASFYQVDAAEVLRDRLIRRALSYPDDGFRLRNMLLEAPHIIGANYRET